MSIEFEEENLSNQFYTQHEMVNTKPSLITGTLLKMGIVKSDTQATVLLLLVSAVCVASSAYILINTLFVTKPPVDYHKPKLPLPVSYVETLNNFV